MLFKSIGLSLSNEESGDIDYTKLKFKVAKAVRISNAPKIDGIIDEVVNTKTSNIVKPEMPTL